MVKKSSETPQAGGAAKSARGGAQKQARTPAAETTTANPAAAAQTGKTAGIGASKTVGGASKSTGEGRSGGGAKSGAAKGGAKSGASAKGASRGAAGGARGASKGASKGASRSGSKTDLRRDLRDFASGRPEGWNHEDWMGFLEHLQSRGHNVNDRDQIGAALERERLSLALEQVQGMGPARVNSIAERYGNIWSLRNTSVDDLARDADIPHPLAERVLESVRG